MSTLQQEFWDLKEEYQEFAYTLSHDFSAPLRQINGFVKLIYDKHKDSFDDETRQYFDFIFNSTKKGQDKIDALLTFSRLNTREDPFELVSLENCYHHACGELGDAIAASNAQIVMKSLPKVKIDEKQMRVLFYHLLDNAIKFQPAGQQPVIMIESQQLEKGWVVKFADNGIGIPNAYYGDVFNIFYRAVAEDEYPGLGLGMTLVKKVAKRHGGDVAISENHGGGTVVTVSINT